MKKAIVFFALVLFVYAFYLVLAQLPAKLEKMDCIKARNICAVYGGDCAFASKCKAE